MKTIKTILYIIGQGIGVIPLSVFFFFGLFFHAMSDITDYIIDVISIYGEWLERKCL